MSMWSGWKMFPTRSRLRWTPVDPSSSWQRSQSGWRWRPCTYGWRGDDREELVELLRGAIRTYAWGSRTAIADFTGRSVPTAHPEAELWLGAHPADPARIE